MSGVIPGGRAIDWPILYPSKIAFYVLTLTVVIILLLHYISMEMSLYLLHKIEDPLVEGGIHRLPASFFSGAIVIPEFH
jgi:hypothetical protein